MKYIPAEKLIAEIERQQKRLILLSNTEQVSVRRDCALQNGAYSYILNIITSLQQDQPEINLEVEYKRFIDCDNGRSMYDCACHFYELGRLNARKEK